MEFFLKEATSDLISEEIGISLERVEELDKIIDEAWDEQRNKITKDFKFMADKCNTIEEFAYVLSTIQFVWVRLN